LAGIPFDVNHKGDTLFHCCHSSIVARSGQCSPECHVCETQFGIIQSHAEEPGFSPPALHLPTIGHYWKSRCDIKNAKSNHFFVVISVLLISLIAINSVDKSLSSFALKKLTQKLIPLTPDDEDTSLFSFN
jgi:hypothetical protein